MGAALKGFNPYRVVEGVELEHNPRVSPLAVEFLPFKGENKPFRISSNQ
jgi:hypothetical protein